MNCVICSTSIGRSKESVIFHNKKYHGIVERSAMRLSEQPCPAPIPAGQYAAIQSRVERRLKDFIIESEADKQLAEFNVIEIPNYGNLDRPPQMTDAEIVMSIERLAERFYENVEILKQQLGVAI